MDLHIDNPEGRRIESDEHYKLEKNYGIPTSRADIYLIFSHSW